MSERITSIIGYSAETSGPNENPRWGHFTARYADGIQEDFERWLKSHDAEVWDEGLREALEYDTSLLYMVDKLFEANPYRKGDK